MRVTVANPNTLQPMTLEFDPGYPDTRWEPGNPGGWYIALDNAASDCWLLTDAQWERIIVEAYNSAEYRAYERAEYEADQGAYEAWLALEV